MDAVEVKQALDNVTSVVKEHAEKAIAEAKRGITMTEGVKQTVDELMVKQTELRAELDAVAKKADRQGGGAEAFKTTGQEFIESKGFEDFKASSQRKKSVSVETKAVVNLTTGVLGLGNLVEADRRPGILGVPDRRLTIRDLLSPGQTDSNLIQWVQETGYQNMVAPVAEGTRKPQSDITFTLKQTGLTKLATFVKASTEILDDAPMLRSYIDYRLRYMLALREDEQLLKGSGTAGNINGIYTQATPYVAPVATTGITLTPRVDILRLALLQSELAEFPATGIVLHPSDLALIEMTKDTTGAYLFGGPQNPMAPTLWRRPVVETVAMTQDTFLVGAFKLGAQIFDRNGATVSLATENEDDFVNNLVTILIEERLGLAMYRPEAFVKGDLTPAV
jgi:HK97 family phage major capsid protein